MFVVALQSIMADFFSDAAAKTAAFNAAVTQFETRYTLGAELQSGAFGTTYLCTENATAKTFVVKKIRETVMSSRTQTPEDRRDFLRREIDNLDSIAGPKILDPHPNIIQYVESFWTPAPPAGSTTPEGVPVCIVMEFAGNGCRDLQELVAQNRLHEDQAKVIFKQISLAVQYLHSISVLHRDIKVDNVLVVPIDPVQDFRGKWVASDPADPNAYKVKLLDFGLSKAIDPAVFDPNAPPHTLGRGTLLAQEVLPRDPPGRDPRTGMVITQGPYGPPSDCYALGVTLFSMLKGGYPKNMTILNAHGRTTGELAQRHAVIEDGEWPGGTSGTPINDKLKDLIRGLIAFDPKDRYTMDQVISHEWLADCP